MDIKQYNNLQSKIFRKYKIDCMLVSDSIRFFKICSAISQYRECKTGYNTTKHIIEIIKEDDVNVGKK